ncbi:hypothetical protein F8154_05465 [Alkaliphilus pronyensis]|uniref:Uncharacterized protein n=1 Tax=Alkaliphilus pronyensis TaxID=1482732 RepID=A0A6I0F6T6_9FIRM|nr:hypothetical protein [Alkaliphilus pronyensis]KAB3535749.1 hypothetical protein F8154_05465 [Alkaliphilus pronyensis]
MDKKNVKTNINEALTQLKENMEICFKHLENNPNDTNEIVDMWKEFGNDFIKESIVMSEKYSNKSIIKGNTKMLIFK